MPTSPENWTWQCDRVIPSDPAVGRRLVEELLEKLEASQWPRRDMFGIQLAVDEALVNAMRHGNALDKTKNVRFCCWLSPQKVRIEITDEGSGFNPCCLPNPTEPPHLDEPHGRGVMLMRSFMSRVEFPEPGNHVVMEKERRGEA